MCNDFYDKYDEYMNVVAERKDRTMRQTNYSLANVEAGHMADFVEKAVSKFTKKYVRDNILAYFIGLSCRAKTKTIFYFCR